MLSDYVDDVMHPCESGNITHDVTHPYRSGNASDNGDIWLNLVPASPGSTKRQAGDRP